MAGRTGAGSGGGTGGPVAVALHRARAVWDASSTGPARARREVALAVLLCCGVAIATPLLLAAVTTTAGLRRGGASFPTVSAAIIAGGLIATYSLVAQARASRDPSLTWIACGVGTAMLGLALQLVRFPQLGASPGVDTAARQDFTLLTPVWHAVLALSALYAVRYGTAARRRTSWARLALVTAGVAVLLLVGYSQSLSALVTADGAYTVLLRVLLLPFVALSGYASWVWARSMDAPDRTRAWILVALLASTLDLAALVVADGPLGLAWWTSLTLRLLTFDGLALGLLAGFVSLLRHLDARAALELSRAQGEVRLATGQARSAEERLARLLDTSTALARAIGLAEVADVLLRRAMETTGATAGSLFAVDPDAEVLRLTSCVGYDELARRAAAELSLTAEVPAAACYHARRTLTWVGREDFEAAFPGSSRWPQLREARSLLFVPLAGGDGVQAVLGLWREEEEHFSAADRELVQAQAALGAQALERASLYERQRGIAEALQHSLLPDTLPTVDQLELAAVYLAGTAGVEVGGDWYDAIPIDDHRTALVIGDVMGKGVGAAARMGELRSAVRALVGVDPRPLRVVAGLDRVATGWPDDELVTMGYAVLDAEARTLTHTCVGHLPPLVLSPDGPTRLLEGATSPPLGLPGSTRTEECVRLSDGDVVLLYTDGLVEERTRSLGDRLAALRSAAGTALAVGDLTVGARQLVNALTPHDQRPDDVTLLAVRLATARPAALPHHPHLRARVDGPERLDLRLPAEPGSTPAARRAVAQLLAGAAVDPDVHDAAMLVVSELVTNAVLHARTPVRVTAVLGPTRLRLAVEDEVPRHPQVKDADEGDTGGRGMALVALSAVDWGVVDLPDGGKSVWCDLALDPDAPLLAPDPIL